MDLADLVRLAAEKGKDLLHVEARTVFSERTGQSWDDYHKAVIAQEAKAKQKRVAALHAEYEKLSVPELYELLTTQATEFALIWQVLKAKQGKLDDEERSRRARMGAVVVRPNPGRLPKQPESRGASDYLKPMSKEYDMPEYDLE